MKKGTTLGIAAALVAGLALAFVFLPLNHWALTLVDWIRVEGALGVAIYSGAYVLATLLFLPGLVLTAGAGFAYGPLWGTLLVSPVSVGAAVLAFALGRTFARGWISRRLARHPTFAAIDEAIENDGFKIVLLLRLSPVLPFNLLNYALGLTRVRMRDYALSSFLGMLPGTFLYVYLGSLVTNASELLSGARPRAGTLSHAIYWGGLVATVIVTIVITRIARKALHRAVNGRGPTPGVASEARP